jgi:hypothetical protein
MHYRLLCGHAVRHACLEHAIEAAPLVFPVVTDGKQSATEPSAPGKKLEAKEDTQKKPLSAVNKEPTANPPQLRLKDIVTEGPTLNNPPRNIFAPRDPPPSQPTWKSATVKPAVTLLANGRKPGEDKSANRLWRLPCGCMTDWDMLWRGMRSERDPEVSAPKPRVVSPEQKEKLEKARADKKKAAEEKKAEREKIKAEKEKIKAEKEKIKAEKARAAAEKRALAAEKRALAEEKRKAAAEKREAAAAKKKAKIVSTAAKRKMAKKMEADEEKEEGEDETTEEPKPKRRAAAQKKKAAVEEAVEESEESDDESEEEVS